MKLEQLLLEELSDDEILEILERDCQQFLESCDNRFLYRGSKTESKEKTLHKVKTRKDRAPRDMNGNTHVLIDNYFEKKYGIRYRSASVFTTGSKENAEDYGSAYAVFPIGEFSFIWSPNVVDLYSNLKAAQTFKKFFSNPFKASKPIVITQEVINSYLDTAKYTNDNLGVAIRKGNEIMISCDEYYIIPLSTIKKIKFKRYVKNMWNKITK